MARVEDERPRAPKPPAGPLAGRIVAKPPAERAAERARVIVERGSPVAWQETRGAVTYTLSLPDGVQVSRGRLFVPRIVCVPPPPVPLDSSYVFVNPPLQVEDGTDHEETNVRGEPILVANFREDPLEALRQIVADCVLRGA